MTEEPREDLREALRDLIPDYRAPADPYLRVGATIRRRRNSRRAWLAAGVAAGAAAAVTVVPALAGPGSPAGIAPAAPRPAGGPPPAGLQPVAAGTVSGRDWRAGSLTLSPSASRCLYGEGGPFSRDLACFPDWTPERNASWVVLVLPDRPERKVTAVLGVAPDDSRRVSVSFGDGRTAVADAVHTATDPEARFFALVVAGSATVRGVTLLAGSGAPVGAPDTEADRPAGCVPAVDLTCSTPPG
ncbi:MAG TPA: hypothetical protein VF109_04225 [Mycobacteriales bacterium]